MRNQDLDPLLDPPQLSALLNDIPIGTIYGWVHRGVGPRPIKVGRHLRWRRSEVERWLDEQTREAS